MTAESRLTMTLDETMFTQRAVRRFRPEPIPDADLQAILEAAIRAPNGGNNQPWHFLVIKDAELRAKLAELYHEAWWAKRKTRGSTDLKTCRLERTPASRPSAWLTR